MWCTAITSTIWRDEIVPAGTRVEMPDDADPNPRAWQIEKPKDDVIYVHMDVDDAPKRRRGRPKKG